MAQQPPLGRVLLIHEVSRSHKTRDQLFAETSTCQHTTLTTDKHQCPRWDSNPLSQQASSRRPTL